MLQQQLKLAYGIDVYAMITRKSQFLPLEPHFVFVSPGLAWKLIRRRD